jgi:uncharacterized protein (TIGR03067 family)
VPAPFVLVLAAIVLMASPADDPKQEESRGTWNELEGHWTLVSVERAGRKVPRGEVGFNKCQVVVPKPEATTGTNSVGWFILTQDKRLFCEMHVKKLDLFASPKELDFFSTRHVEEGLAGVGSEFPCDYQAIYRLVDDDLTVCLGKRDGGRPKALTTEKDSEPLLIKFRRAKK